METDAASYTGEIELRHSTASAESLLGRLIDPDQADSLNSDAPILIPSLQREFCWGLEDIVDLFDSVLRGLPIGTLLLWDAAPSDREIRNEAQYKFIRHYANRSNFPSDDAPETVNYHSDKLEGQVNFDTYTFALDGQQRLTSFLIGLRGSFYEHRYRKHTDNYESYYQKFLCLDLLTDPTRTPPEDAQENIYRFDFRRAENIDHISETGTYDPETGTYWFPVSTVWTDDGKVELTDQPDPETFVGDGMPARVTDNLDRLVTALTADQIPCEEVRKMESKEALELFIRRNKGGEELSNSDIAFSLITVYWDEFDDDGRDPKDIFESRAAELTQKFNGYSFSFGKGFLIRALLYLNGKKPSFEQDNLTPETINDLEYIWGSEFFDTIRMAFGLVTEEFGLTGKCLTGKTAILPIMYYCWESRDDLDDYTDVPPIVRKRMEYWLELTVLNNIFNVSSSMSVLNNVQTHISADTFDVLDIAEEYRDGSVTIGVHTEAEGSEPPQQPGRSVKSLVTESDHSSRTTARNYLLTKLYEDRGVGRDFNPESDEVTRLEIEAKDEVTSIEIDHFFPASKLRNNDNYLENYLTGSEFEFNEDSIANIKTQCKNNVNRFANFTLLPRGAGNQSKGEKDPEKWLSSPSVDRALATEIHHLPNLEAYTYDRYLEFLAEREKSMIEILQAQLVLEDDI